MTSEAAIPKSAGRGSSSSAELAQISEEYWSVSLQSSPLSATLLGVHEYDDCLDDLSVEAEQDHRAALLRLQHRCDAVDTQSLTPIERVTRSVLAHYLHTGIESADLRLIELACDQMDGPHAALLMLAPQLTYPEPEHAQAALKRYAEIPRMLGQAVERFLAGLEVGRTPAQRVIARSIHSLDLYLASPLDSDPFLAAGLPKDWSGADQWQLQMAQTVRERIRPAFVEYRDALRDQIAPSAREDDKAGWCWLPQGEELYGALIRSHTTSEFSASELHALGKEITEGTLQQEYLALAQEPVQPKPSSAAGTSATNYSYDANSLQSVFEYLRTDPSLRHVDAAEIVELAERSVARATEALPAFFGLLPSSPCRVSPIPDFLAEDAPYAYYFPPAIDRSRPGTYFINTSHPEEASRTEAESIAFHEAIPGHHLQIAISQELTGLPEFQRHDGPTAYIEGWALYAERLADEMGLYSDRVARFGMLAADSWRSARLVVDTGLHAMGWSRQQAVDYFEEHTPVPKDQISGEVDRYLAIPGQALSYKVGQLEFLRLRSYAEDALGERFELPAFHDTVLGAGAVTLPVLRDLVETWVAGQVT
ncbi:unannotated protein [freshwater metagenome]|uniref:Unannotated protein n=1 Tax=freshwater metagenome TaxID=449393 RepID=A0A6J6TZE8_9ZZZZ